MGMCLSWAEMGMDWQAESSRRWGTRTDSDWDWQRSQRLN